jgi:chromosome segregation ATPase
VQLSSWTQLQSEVESLKSQSEVESLKSQSEAESLKAQIKSLQDQNKALHVTLNAAAKKFRTQQTDITAHERTSSEQGSGSGSILGREYPHSAI